MDRPNPLLRLQLKRMGLAKKLPNEDEWEQFIKEVSSSYDEFELQHERLNRALFQSTEEANEALAQIKLVNRDMQKALVLMREQMDKLVAAYPDKIVCRESAGGGVTGLIGQFEDLAETWQALVNETEEGRALADELRIQADAASAAKSSFLAAMSHEIRTPLNGVIGMAELMQGTKLTHDQREYVETIQTCGETLLSLIDGILDYSKIEAGEMVFEQQPFSINKAVEDCIDVLRYIVSQKKVNLLFDLQEPGDHYFLGDETRFRQVITNLLGNASKFTETGEIVVEVSRNKLAERKGEWLVRVRDTGPGIPESELGSLFQVFYQAKAAELRTQGGTGLGLAISRRIVEEFGGEIWAESTQGVGSVFSFTFSLPPVEPEHVIKKTNEKLEWIEGKKVFIIDDNETNLKILKRYVNQLHAHPETFLEFQDLIDRVEQDGLPDLLISDQEMPGIHGEELIDKLMTQSEQHNQKMKALLISSVPVNNINLPRTICTVKPLRYSDLISHLSNLGFEGKPAKVAPEQKLIFDSYPYSVLVAEDNPINQRLVQLMLKRMGIEAEFCEDGALAFEYVQEHHPDVILMDIQMPHMDGYQATEAIRKAKLPKQPLIMGLTANALTDERARAYRIGMDDYLTKPIVTEVLFKALERAKGILDEQ
ncbi:response regulator [Rubritalea marina]|uniref:response regulator n=1 Tax=Rubritalea marina TaxID=361055 RepID=UPI0003689D36|nr:response regulator [Rubritalea marina]